MLASEQELEIFKHEQQLEQLQELWEEGIIPTEAEYMEMLEELEARHQDRLTEMQEKGEAERLALIEKAAQMETQARRAALQEAVGFLDQLAGKSKAAALAAIVLNRGLAIAQIIQNTAAAQMRAMAELGPIAGPPAEIGRASCRERVSASVSSVVLRRTEEVLAEAYDHMAYRCYIYVRM